MIKITLGTNLIACERPTFPALHPLFDLADNLTAARTLIVAVDRFFSIDLDEVRMSGYARKHDSYDGDPGDVGPAFYAQIWHGDKVYRTAAFRNLGYTGILHIEIPAETDPKDAFDFDMIGDMCNAHELLREDGYAERCIGYVGDGKLTITVPQSYDAR